MGSGAGPLVVVQARTGSRRLPAKVLADLGGTTVLEWLVTRASRSRSTGGLVVATTTDAEDDRIAELGQRAGFAVFRGHPSDVLQRFVDLVAEREPSAVVRLSADSPFIDAEAIDTVVDAWKAGEAGLVENHSQHGWPCGVAVEALSRDVLAWLDRTAREENQREHVTLAAYKSDKITRAYVPAPEPLRGEDFRLCIDTQHDLEASRRHVELHRWDPSTPLSAMLKDLRTP